MADVLDNNNGGQQGADGNNNNGGTTPPPEPKTPTIEDLQLQLAEERAKAQKFKSSFDKVSSEVAEYKKQLRAKLTEDEQKQLEIEEERAKQAEYIKELEDFKKRSDATSRYVTVVGMSAELAKEAVDAELNGDMDALAQVYSKHNEMVKKQMETEFLKGRPPINNGSNGSALTKEDILAITDPVERQRLIAENIELFEK
jgi:hypothetical protein